ncbi:response regulator transcription factor [Amycolatopsis sp. Poz14]|uniref:response regulator transcription factor n=1 Tax=Amycolatopsis sp. Poz14 TaxID=1447705 RepID=UPI001EE85969|nr:response regulator transcription factor [Amycolatopsis sp. Poz14]MCG3752603.1 response regulator transcription factor [Amycolatopsis sp. Poz14]
MIRVVVVDDEELVRSGFRLILQAAGDIEVVATVSGAQAVKEAGLQRPDVVLLDIRMPDVDGLTVLRQLRGLASPPVVAMLTTFDSDEYIATALRSGAAGFILIADGLSNGDIAKRVHVSVGTVKDHVSAILTKLGVGSRVQAALVAQRAGLLESHEP